MVNISGKIRISLHQFINIAIQDKMPVFAEIAIAYLHHQLKKCQKFCKLTQLTVIHDSRATLHRPGDKEARGQRSVMVVMDAQGNVFQRIIRTMRPPMVLR